MKRHRLVFTGPALLLFALLGVFRAPAASAQQGSHPLPAGLKPVALQARWSDTEAARPSGGAGTQEPVHRARG